MCPPTITTASSGDKSTSNAFPTFARSIPDEAKHEHFCTPFRGRVRAGNEDPSASPYRGIESASIASVKRELGNDTYIHTHTERERCNGCASRLQAFVVDAVGPPRAQHRSAVPFCRVHELSSFYIVSRHLSKHAASRGMLGEPKVNGTPPNAIGLIPSTSAVR